MSDMEPRRPQRIGELARKTGKTERTLRFYEEMDLLAPVDRTPGGFRLYGEDAELRIHWIERLQDLGFSLVEIREFLEGVRRQPSPSTAMASLREFYGQKLEETRDKLARLVRLERELQESLDFLGGCTSCAGVGLHSCHCFDAGVENRPPALVAAVYTPANPSAARGPQAGPAAGEGEPDGGPR